MAVAPTQLKRCMPLWGWLPVVGGWHQVQKHRSIRFIREQLMCVISRSRIGLRACLCWFFPHLRLLFGKLPRTTLPAEPDT